MITTQPRFGEMGVEAPDLKALAGQYEALEGSAAACTSEDERRRFVVEWETVRRRVLTWTTLARLRFQQDTASLEAKAMRDQADRVGTELTLLDGRIKAIMLEESAREAWKPVVGAQALALWAADVAAYDPSIASELVEEQRLCAEYGSLFGTAEVEFEGEPHTLSELTKHFVDPDRKRRRAAEQARWSWFTENRETLDELFDELVKGRDAMARKVGFQDFVAMGYERKRRVDYNRDDVERFRKQVRERLVPLCARIVERQAKEIGVESIKLWDERVFAPGESPSPRGDHDWMMDRASEMFAGLSGSLSEFFQVMASRDLLDLKSRRGKAMGGFCTYLHDYKVPFIFANFNGTRGDVRVFTHEMGHAYQRWSSSAMPLTDYTGCTSESAEIHSMSLEFLSWPEMERFFGDSADEFRRVHLLEQLLFIPYGVAVDEFQHAVYENPQASPEERFKMWKRIESTYMPWRDCDDLTHASQGGYWQWQRHIYLYPFYYIDYTLAAACALQFWDRAQSDHKGAMREYEALCARGGSLPFRELTSSAGLISPFDEGCLDQVIQSASTYLGLAE